MSRRREGPRDRGVVEEDDPADQRLRLGAKRARWAGGSEGGACLLSCVVLRSEREQRLSRGARRGAARGSVAARPRPAAARARPHHAHAPCWGRGTAPRQAAGWMIGRSGALARAPGVFWRTPPRRRATLRATQHTGMQHGNMCRAHATGAPWWRIQAEGKAWGGYEDKKWQGGYLNKAVVTRPRPSLARA